MRIINEALSSKDKKDAMNCLERIIGHHAGMEFNQRGPDEAVIWDADATDGRDLVVKIVGFEDPDEG